MAEFLGLKKEALIQKCLDLNLPHEGKNVKELRASLIENAVEASKLASEGRYNPNPEYLDFLREKQKVDAEYKAREAEKWKVEAEFKNRELEQTRALKDRDMEKWRVEAEFRDRELQLEAERLHLEREKLKMKGKKEGDPDVRYDIPRVTPKDFIMYVTGEDPQIFLSTFEKSAQNWGIPETQYMKYLPSLIRGELAEIYNTFPSDRPVIYAEYKEAVYDRFRLCADYFRKKFRSMTPQKEKSFKTFSAQLTDSFDKWISSAKADSKEKLRELMILDQFLFQLPSEIRLLVKDKLPENVKQAAEWADKLLLNRGGWEKYDQRALKSKVQPQRSPETERKRTYEWTEITKRQDRNTEENKGSYLRERQCYTCGRTGHLSYQCEKNPIKQRSPEHVRRVTSFTPEKEREQPRDSNSTTEAYEKSNRATTSIIAEEKIYLCGVKIDNVAQDTELREVIQINEREAVAILDTGAAVTLVSQDLVNKENMIPDSYISLQGVWGTSQCVPLAQVRLSWRGKEGSFPVAVISDQKLPVILGRDVMGAKARIQICSDANELLQGEPTGPESKPLGVIATSATDTFKQPERAQASKPLVSFEKDSPVTEVADYKNTEDFKGEVKTDSELKGGKSEFVNDVFDTEMQNREEERPSEFEGEILQLPSGTVTSNKRVTGLNAGTKAEAIGKVEIEKEESNISLQLPANRQASYLSNASSEEGKLTQNTCLLESASEKLEHASAADISIATQVDGTLTVEAKRVEIAEVFNVHLPNPKGGKTFSEVLIPCKTTEPLIPKKRAVLQNLKELPEATPTELRQLTKVKLLDKQGEDTLQELFIFLRDVTHRLVINKRFRDFAKLTDWYKVPEYETVIQQPMDLSATVSKIDLICSNALEHNPDSGNSENKQQSSREDQGHDDHSPAAGHHRDDHSPADSGHPRDDPSPAVLQPREDINLTEDFT